ncbi:hypothetical protein [Paenibacillus daejeonensis]|uniref:hypothetical protein n=1 Tax=Paenibacillus daejeonensis TaxID=135193 RepID=UPI00035C3400|nr:hypothetical protein [Paenibacillus daejeonensis]
MKPRTSWRTVLLMALMTVLLSGCMYPRENLAQNQGGVREAVRNMQSVIEEYQERTGLLPILNSDAETPTYEKYRIDMKRLQELGYIGEIPSLSFEKGGNYYFMIINETTEPAVKLMDLVLFQRINEIERAISEHRTIGGGGLPVGEEAYPGFYRIDYSQLTIQEPQLRSVFSGSYITAMIDEEGVVYADYGMDIARLIREGDVNAGPEEDLRALLAEQSDYVPVKAPVYQMVDGEVQAAANVQP